MIVLNSLNGYLQRGSGSIPKFVPALGRDPYAAARGKATRGRRLLRQQTAAVMGPGVHRGDVVGVASISNNSTLTRPDESNKKRRDDRFRQQRQTGQGRPSAMACRCRADRRA